MCACSCTQKSINFKDLKEVLVLGSEASGKTTLIRGIKNMNCRRRDRLRISDKHIPTRGVEVDIVKCGRYVLKMREVGYAFYENWSLYFGYCDILLYLLDNSLKNEKQKRALDELSGVLNHIDISEKPVLLVWTKDIALEECKKAGNNRRKIHSSYKGNEIPIEYQEQLSMHKKIRLDTRDKQQIKKIIEELALLVKQEMLNS